MPPTVACVMICRNEAKNLPACLGSIKGIFTEILITDTGSEDDTRAIARRFGARVNHFQWCNDFAKARNYGLDRVQADYVFRLDADDRIDRGQHKRLKALFTRLGEHPQPTAYSFRVHATEPGGTVGMSDEIRLWPNHPALRFRGKIHERIVADASKGLTSLPVVPSGVRIEHVGYENERIRQRKLRRNLQILRTEFIGNPDDPLIRFDLGRTYFGLGEYHESAINLRKYLGSSSPREDVAHRAAHRMLVRVLIEAHKPREAMEAAREGLTAHPDDATLMGAIAGLMADGGETELAIEGYEWALKLHAKAGDRMEFGLGENWAEGVKAELARLTRLATETEPVPVG